jgi:hypothetical protein
MSHPDQREDNNLPKMHDEQKQGKRLVTDEAKAASELRLAEIDLDEAVRLKKIRDRLLDVQDFVFRHRCSNPATLVEVTGKEISDLKWAVQRALDLT